MKPAESEPQLTAGERAAVDVLRKHAQPAPAPEDFIRSLRPSGPSVISLAAIAPKPAMKFRFMASGMAAAAALALAWLFLHTPKSDPRQLAAQDKMLTSAAQTAKEPAASPSPPISADDLGPPMNHGRLISTRQVAVIRRENGLPPVQFVAVNDMHIRPFGTTRRIEMASRLVPVVLKYH